MNEWPPGTDAEELARLDTQIATLTERLEQMRQTFVATDAALRATQQRRRDVYARLTLGDDQRQPGSPSQAAMPSPPSEPESPAQAGAPFHPGPEASTRTVQNVLFVLGGLLLGTAAIVFTAVAWSRYGVTGRAVILAVVTALALLTPPIALWRRLTATAETFAAVGLLLVVLDGYAAWYVNLFGVQSIPATRYSGMVAIVTAGVALAYRLGTRLMGPGLVALAAVQPVLPLLLAGESLGVAEWSLVFAAVALLDLGLLWGWRTRSDVVSVVMRAGAWFFFGAGLLVAAVMAYVAELVARDGPDAALAGMCVVVVGLLLVGGAMVTRSSAFQALAGCGLLLTVVAGAGRFVDVVWPRHTFVLVAAVVTVTAVLAGLASRLDTPVVPAPLRSGLTAGGLVAAGGMAAVVIGESLTVAGRTVADALPIWRAPLEPGSLFADWQLLAAVPLLVVALVAVLPRSAYAEVVAGGAVTATLALPGSVSLVWWLPSAVDITVAAALLLAALVASARRTAVAVAAGAGALGVHAFVTSLARAENTAAILAAVVLVGAVTALASRSTVEDCPPHRRAIGGTGLFLSLFALPPAIGSALVSVEVTPWWVIRLAAASVVLVLLGLVLVRRWLTPLFWYAFAALVTSVVIRSIAPLLSDTAESVGVYAAAGLVVIVTATAMLPPGSRLAPAAACATPTVLLLAIDVVPPLWTALITPYAWLGAVWSGAPNGVGLTPPGHGLDTAEIRGTHAVALAGLALSVAIASYAVMRTARAAAGGLFVASPVAIVVGLAAANPSWPTVAGVSLLLGLGLAVFAAIARLAPPVSALTALQGVTLAGAGLAGSLPEKWSTLAALGLVVVASGAVGAAGRTVGSRIAGWLTGVASALTLIVAAARAADLPLRDAALPVLALAAVALAGGTVLGRRAPQGRATESVAVQASAHASAVVALLLTIGSLRYAAVVCTMWGIAVGLRALWPGTGRSARAAFTAAAAACELLAWWLLLADLDVATLEAYTVPLAGVALLAGWAARRAQPAVHSWTAYGPALLAAFLPSLATIVFTEGEPLRRFLLGVGALAVVVAGSVRRQQAPVVVGGIVLALVALHEIVLFWDRLPRWLPLAVGGLLLVGLAITYERRRRDLARLRESVSRMH